MNVFETHKQIVDDYDQYIRSFINIADPEIAQKVEASLSEGRLWPPPLLQFNPALLLTATPLARPETPFDFPVRPQCA